MPIRIRSSVNGFRRAGVAHSVEPKTYPDNFFSEAQIAQLKAEPRLAVEFLKEDQTDPSSSTTASTGAVGTGSTSDDLKSDQGENLLQPLLDVIAGLDPHDEALWNKDGSPKANNFPAGTSAEDRANAWEMFQAKSDEA